MGITTDLKKYTNQFNTQVETIKHSIPIEINETTPPGDLDKIHLGIAQAIVNLDTAITTFEKQLAGVKRTNDASPNNPKQPEINQLFATAEATKTTTVTLRDQYRTTLSQSTPAQADTASMGEASSASSTPRNQRRPLASESAAQVTNPLDATNKRLQENIAQLTTQLVAAKQQIDSLTTSIGVQKAQLESQQRLLDLQHSSKKPSAHPLTDTLGQILTLRYEPHATGIKKLVKQFTDYVLELEAKAATANETATQVLVLEQLNLALKLLTRQIEPKAFSTEIAFLPGHPRKELRRLGEIMALLGAAVLAALGTALGLGVIVPSAAIVVPAIAASASLLTLTGLGTLFNARSKGMHQTAEAIVHHVGKLAPESIIATPMQ